MQGGALEQMQGLVQQAVAPDWCPLPQAMQKAAAFQEGVHALVFDVLMDKVTSAISGSPKPTKLLLVGAFDGYYHQYAYLQASGLDIPRRGAKTPEMMGCMLVT